MRGVMLGLALVGFAAAIPFALPLGQDGPACVNEVCVRAVEKEGGVTLIATNSFAAAPTVFSLDLDTSGARTDSVSRIGLAPGETRTVAPVRAERPDWR